MSAQWLLFQAFLHVCSHTDTYVGVFAQTHVNTPSSPTLVSLHTHFPTHPHTHTHTHTHTHSHSLTLVVLLCHFLNAMHLSSSCMRILSFLHSSFSLSLSLFLSLSLSPSLCLSLSVDTF